MGFSAEQRYSQDAGSSRLRPVIISFLSSLLEGLIEDRLPSLDNIVAVNAYGLALTLLKVGATLGQRDGYVTYPITA